MRKLTPSLEFAGLLALVGTSACGSHGGDETTAGWGLDAATDAVQVAEGGMNALPDGPGPSLWLGGPDAADGSPTAALEAGTPEASVDTGAADAQTGDGATGAQDAGGPDGDTGDATGSSIDDGGLWVDSRAAYCAGSGPPITVGDTVSQTNVCTGGLAELTFTHALCSCSDANIQGVFKTDSFNSTTGTYQPGQTGGAVGVNDSFVVAGVPAIGGTLAIGGSSGWTLGGAGSVAGDLDVAGNVTLAGVTSVGRDVWVEGNVTSAGVLDVGRDLHQTPGNFVVGIVGVGGSTDTSTSFTLPEPCACADSEILDISAIVSQGQAQNDNAAIGLSPSAYDALVGVADVTLPCGRFYLDQIAGVGDVTFHVPGRTALFVGGDVASAGVLSFDIGAQGELDLFVRGNLVPTGLTTFGNAAHPAATRIYVGGSDNVLLTGAGEFVGNIYAPRATVIATGYSDFYGSIFAGNFEAPGALFIHYDRGVLAAGQECPPTPPPAADGGSSTTGSPAIDSGAPDSGAPPVADSGPGPSGPDAGSTSMSDAATQAPDAMSSPPPACSVCGTCTAGTACVNGGCGSCRTDADCCSPFVCTILNGTGTCGPLLQ
jgi:hypothetical protein